MCVYDKDEPANTATASSELPDQPSRDEDSCERDFDEDSRERSFEEDQGARAEDDEDAIIRYITDFAYFGRGSILFVPPFAA